MPFEKGNKLAEGQARGPGKKNKDWEELSEYMIGEGSKKVLKYLGTLKGQELFDKYERLLNYFKPKHAATTVQAEIRIPELRLQLKDPEAMKAIERLTAQFLDVTDVEIIEPKQIKSNQDEPKRKRSTK